MEYNVRMLRFMQGVVLLSYLWLGPSQTSLSDEQHPGKETNLEQFRGRWTTSRESKENDKVRRYELVLEFKDGELTFVTEEDGKKGNQFTLKVLEVEKGVEAPRLILAHGDRSKYAIHYDFVGDRLILVGRLLNRPFEGFSLSGEYKQLAKP